MQPEKQNQNGKQKLNKVSKAFEPNAQKNDQCESFLKNVITEGSMVYVGTNLSITRSESDFR